MVSHGLPYLDFSVWQRSGEGHSETPAQPGNRAEWMPTVAPLNGKLQPQNPILNIVSASSH